MSREKNIGKLELTFTILGTLSLDLSDIDNAADALRNVQTAIETLQEFGSAKLVKGTMQEAK